MTFIDWLRDFIDTKYHGAVTNLAREIHLSPVTIYSYLSGELAPKEENVIKLVIAAGGKIDDEAYEDWKARRKEADLKSGGKSDTICWDCQNAVPDKCGHGCSWSRKLIPVDGWTAKGTRIRQKGVNAQGYCGSYIVIRCPQFVPEGSILDEMDNDAEKRERWLEKAATLVAGGGEIKRRESDDAREKKRIRSREMYYIKRGRPVPTEEEIAKKKKERDAKRHREAYARKKRKERYAREVEKEEAIANGRQRTNGTLKPEKAGASTAGGD